MSEFESKSNCAAFQAQLPVLVGSGEDLANHPHLQNCELCSSLLADLETIAEAARQLFPIEEPPDNLWEQIESRIKSDNPADDFAPGKPLPRPA